MMIKDGRRKFVGRRWMKEEGWKKKIDEEEHMGKMEISQDNEKSDVFWFIMLRQFEFQKYNAIFVEFYLYLLY